MVTDGYLANQLSYGLGLEGGIGPNGTVGNPNMCGVEFIGHGGEDYGSGGVVRDFTVFLNFCVDVLKCRCWRKQAAKCSCL